MNLRTDPQKQSFFSHLDELRRRFLICAAATVAAGVAAYSFTDILFLDLLKPVGHVIFTSPSDAFAAKLQLAVILGVVVASPVICYQVWKFVHAGLKESERKYVRSFAFLSLVLFIAGVVFAYKIAVPFMIGFFLGFASDQMIPMITVSNYMSFVGSTLAAFGVIFEMPLVMAFLTKIGIATPAFLMQKRRHAIILILVISAVITPPDIFSQIIMAVPLLVLYEIGVIASIIVFKNSGNNSAR